jgi:hypothetical protein
MSAVHVATDGPCPWRPRSAHSPTSFLNACMPTIKLDEIEIEALQRLAIGKALGRESSRQPHASRRMVDLGLVDHNVDGQLQATEAGRDWLAAWNSRYSVR